MWEPSRKLPLLYSQALVLVNSSKQGSAEDFYSFLTQSEEPLCLMFFRFFVKIDSDKLFISSLHLTYLRGRVSVYMRQVVQREGSPTFKKRISVSQKRQITIPVEFFNIIGVQKEVECYVQNNAIVIRPIREGGGELDEQILADLISQGFSGQELLAKFKETRRQIRPAVERLLDEAHLAAVGKTQASTYEDVFGAEDK